MMREMVGRVVGGMVEWVGMTRVRKGPFGMESTLSIVSTLGQEETTTRGMGKGVKRV